MINLYEKGRIPSQEKEILTKSFLIDKIANDMKSKYKKVLSFINYDEFSLKNDIHRLLTKYISNNKKEINIKYIETTLLNKVREKYRRKTPLKVNNKKNLIKIVDSSSRRNIYIKKEENKENKIKNKLPVIKNKIINRDFIMPKRDKSYSKTCVDIDNFDNSNENEKIVEIDQKIDNLVKEENMMKEEINKEKDEIMKLEEYKKNIQKQIDDINKEIEKENEKIQKEPNINDINTNNRYNTIDLNNNSNKKEEIQEEFNWNCNPSMSFDQMKYLERKQKIEEDCYNKENKYTFLKPSIKENDNNNNQSNNNNNKRSFRLNNIRINNSMNNLKKINNISQIEEIKKDNNNNIKNIRASNFTFADYVDYNNNTEKEKDNNIIPYEEKIQLKILQRSIAQEKAFNHLRSLLSPEKQFLNESNYQGFNNSKNEDSYDKKKKELEIADEARKLQIAKMRELLDASIIEKENRKKAEKEFDKKYREINEREYENYLEKENKKKLLKNEKMQNYRKMLEEQIEEKKKLMLKDDLNNPFNLDNMF